MKRIYLFISLLIFISCTGQHNESTGELSSDQENDTVAADSLQELGNMDSIYETTFAVSDVEMADSLLKTDKAIEIMEAKVGKAILFSPVIEGEYELVNCPNNGLVQTIQECYDNHRPLILTPDVIWLAICQGVSIHINQNYDSLKGYLFVENKPDQIVVRNDSLEYDAKHWASLMASFSNETKKYTKSDYYSFFVSKYSTTTDMEKTAYQITLLESCKKAFQYIGETGCGIPSITLKGRKQDWQSMLSKLDQLDKLGMASWKNNLQSIISEFVGVYDGKVNKEFWQSIYKDATEYNAFYLSGWIIKLFPYTIVLADDGVYDTIRNETKIEKLYVPNEFMDGDRYLLSTLSTDEFPSGIAEIDVTWNNYLANVEKKVEVYAGFFAMKQYPDKALEPFISWAICEKQKKTIKHKLSENKDLKLNHTEDYWSPHICVKPKVLAVYDNKRFSSNKECLAFIKECLEDSIKNNAQFTNQKISPLEIEFTVYSNGNIGDVKVKTTDPVLKDFVTKQLFGLPEKWYPALSNPMDVLELWDMKDEENKLKVRVNSNIVIQLFAK